MADEIGVRQLIHHFRSKMISITSEEFVQESFHPREGIEPAAVEQRLVNVVGVHDELIIDVTSAQKLHESNRLGEIDVAVVIAMHQEDGRLPVIDLGDGRRGV